MSCRHYRRRARAKALKADCEILLRKIAKTGATIDDLHDEIAEMRVRLKPPPGVKAPIVLTGYTAPAQDRIPKKPSAKWASSIILRDGRTAGVLFKKD